ncbi:MAG: MarR family transcriptional regulator [Chitinophagales bacterium]|nr:MarR family transcriptional regulator [Chitinophagales bacterium]
MQCEIFGQYTYLVDMELFQQLAQQVLLYHLRANWLSVSKLFNDLAKEYDSTLAMAFALLAIDEEGTPVTKIAPRMGLEPNSLSRLLNSLEEKGAVMRKNSEKDQRKVYVHLTEYGKQLRIIAIQTAFVVENEITKDLSAEERKLVIKVMQNIFKVVSDLRDNTELLKEKRKDIKTDMQDIIALLEPFFKR